VDARDVASVSVITLTTNDNQQHIGKAYAITGQEAISYEQAAEILSKEVGKRVSYVNIPKEDAQKGMKENSGLDDWIVDAIMEFYSIIREGHASQTSNIVEQITGRSLYLLVSLPRIMQELSNSHSIYSYIRQPLVRQILVK
jgi:uncharacterized protein YbjT (DUF2867 family)